MIVAATHIFGFVGRGKHVPDDQHHGLLRLSMLGETDSIAMCLPM